MFLFFHLWRIFILFDHSIGTFYSPYLQGKIEQNGHSQYVYIFIQNRLQGSPCLCDARP